MLRRVLEDGSPIDPRGQSTLELRNCVVTLSHPMSMLPNTACDERNLKMADYEGKESELYASGTIQVSDWVEASSFWGKLANPDGSINSNYGYLVDRVETPSGFTQWDWALNRLRSDLSTRQAIMRFNSPVHQFNEVKDFPCTMHMSFSVREGLLECDTVMRSQDVVKGFPYDLCYFLSLHERMGQELDLPLGAYTHLSHSMHMYKRDRETVERMLF